MGVLTIKQVKSFLSVEQARKNTEEVMNGTTIDYEFVSVTETKILDVFEQKGK